MMVRVLPRVPTRERRQATRAPTWTGQCLGWIPHHRGWLAEQELQRPRHPAPHMRASPIKIGSHQFKLTVSPAIPSLAHCNESETPLSTVRRLVTPTLGPRHRTLLSVRDSPNKTPTTHCSVAEEDDIWVNQNAFKRHTWRKIERLGRCSSIGFFLIQMASMDHCSSFLQP